MAAILRNVLEAAKPNLATFVKYAKVELTPPTPADIPEIARGIKSLMSAARGGRWKNLTVREAWLNTLVTVEVFCWFYIGECIGKRNLIAYKIEV